MPSAALYTNHLSLTRTPASGNGCVCNIRGQTPNSMKDYVNSSRTFTVANIDTLPTQEGGVPNWSNSIPTSFNAPSENAAGLIQSSSLITTSVSGLIILRLYIKQPASTFIEKQIVFANGTPDQDGFGIVVQCIGTGEPPTYTYNVFFIDLLDLTTFSNILQINASPLSYNTWYSYVVSFTTANAGKGDVTTVTSYENGVNTQKEISLQRPLTTPTGFTTFFSNYNGGNGFYGRIAEFAFLEGSDLSLNQLTVFGSAPYI